MGLLDHVIGWTHPFAPDLQRRWQALPERTRQLATLAAEVVIVLLATFLWAGSWGAILAIAFAFAWLPRRSYRVTLPAAGRRTLHPRTLTFMVAALLLAIFYPQYVTHLASIPIFGAFPSLDTAVVMLVFIMMAIGLNMVVGYAGLLDLGYVAFYAMGAYTAGWFASPQFAAHTFHLGSVGVGSSVPGFHVNLWLVLIMAGVFTAFAGVLIGLPTLRLRGDYLAIVTLGFGEIMPQIARNGDNLFGTGFNLTSGAQGITPIDSPGFGDSLHNALGLPISFVTEQNSTELFYWAGIGLVLVTAFCSYRLRESRLGRAWIAIREDEIAAAAMGIPLMRTKTWAYAAGAFFGGVAGAYFASFKTATFPDDFQFNISVFILCMVILGGMGSIWGCVVGGAFLAYLNQDGLGNIGGWFHDKLGITVDVPKYSFLIYGLIILVVMLFRPQGLVPSARRKAELEEGVHDQPLMDVTA